MRSKIEEALALFYSMVCSGEAHTPVSVLAMAEAQDELRNLRAQLAEAIEEINRHVANYHQRDIYDNQQQIIIQRLNRELAEAQNAREDTMAENVVMGRWLGEIHKICFDAGLDPGNVVDRVQELAKKADALGRLEEMKMDILSIERDGGFWQIITHAFLTDWHPTFIGCVTEAYERSKP